jgi:hypothetical protein
MKLVRFGPAGREKPGMIDVNGQLRDLSAIIPDIGAAQLDDKTLANLAKLKTDTLPKVQRGLERLLQRRDPAEAAEPNPNQGGVDDDLGALEECRLAVEQLVLAQGQPVELLPRSERVRRLQAELAARYQLASAEFGSGRQQRLRIFPR